MAQFEWVHAAWLALAIVLEIVANVFFKPLKGSTCLSLMHCGAGLVLPPR